MVATPGQGKETTPSSPLPGESARAVVPWFPGWAREFAEQYFAGTTCLFVMHGNVHDLTLQEDGNERDYGSIVEFLATQLFGSWDVVLRYDLSQGLRIAAGSDGERLRKMVALLGERIGEPKSWPRDPDVILALLDKLIQGILMEEDPAKRISLGIILDHAQYLVPTAELSPDGRHPGDAAGAVAVLGAKPLYQAEKHRFLPVLRPAWPRSTSG